MGKANRYNFGAAAKNLPTALPATFEGASIHFKSFEAYFTLGREVIAINKLLYFLMAC